MLRVLYVHLRFAIRLSCCLLFVVCRSVCLICNVACSTSCVRIFGFVGLPRVVCHAFVGVRDMVYCICCVFFVVPCLFRCCTLLRCVTFPIEWLLLCTLRFCCLIVVRVCCVVLRLKFVAVRMVFDVLCFVLVCWFLLFFCVM